MFNIQRFGDNDTITSNSELALGYERSDGSIQYIKLQNPKLNLTESAVRSAMKNLTDNAILLDSKDGSAFSESSIFTAYTEEKVTKNLDIS